VGSEIVNVKMRWDFVGVGLGERLESLVACDGRKYSSTSDQVGSGLERS
jgi:hypothetical protein